MAARALELDVASGMHGDIVPALSWQEALLRPLLGVLFRRAARDGAPSLSFSRLVEDFAQWTAKQGTQRSALDDALVRNAFRDDLGELTGGRVLGYDVSHHQGAVDHEAFVRAGYMLGICKATEGGREANGDGYVDPRFAENWAGMREAGLIRTAYHFARVSKKTSDGFVGFERDGVNEALWFLEHYGPAVLAGMLPPVLDIEWDKRATKAGVTADDVLAFCVAFVQTIRDELGVWPIVYTGPNFWRWRLRRSLRLAKCPLWLVTGYRTPDIYEPAERLEIDQWDWFLHQYTNRAERPDGGRGGVDANFMRGGPEALRAMALISEDHGLLAA